MKINIKQEGGFIGMASKAKLDYKNLTEEEQKTLDSIAERAVAEMEQKSAPQTIERDLEAPSGAAQAPLLRAPSPMARDTFSYSLSMKKDGKKVDVAFDDTNAPPELVAFFQKYITM
jgi:hypothetical protein